MRYYYDFRLGDRTIDKREIHGEEIVRAGRYLIAKTLLELGVANGGVRVAGCRPADLLAGPFADGSFSNANIGPRGLQESADRRHQGSQWRRQLQLGLGQQKIAG